MVGAAGTLPAVAPYYLTTPIYYVNDAPHVGTAYTTVNADALARWHRLLGDDVFFMTGTDEHGAEDRRSGRSPRHLAAGVDRPDLCPLRGGVEAAQHQQRRLHSHDRAPAPRSGPGVPPDGSTTTASSSSGTYTGLYCVSCEDYYTADQLVDGTCPVHGRPVVEMQEDNYFFRLSAFEQPLLDYYESHPDFVRPNAKRNEALGSSVAASTTSPSPARPSGWGVPVPWDDGHVFYVWYDALINYLTVASYGSDPDRFARCGGRHTT